MNTKYPLNGRYTTLGDLVHEYGKYSQWPDDILNKEEESQKLYKFFWDGINQPFNELIFPNNSERAVKPYELVWFDNVYSKTDKNPDGKQFKVIQTSDSSLFGFGREIVAYEIQKNEDLKKIGIPFRFIIPNDNQDRYYYNYKTSDGESVVLYALRNIIDICKKNTLDASIFLFNSEYKNIDNSDNKKLYIINKTEIQTELFPCLLSYDIVTSEDFNLDKIRDKDNQTDFNKNNLYKYAELSLFNSKTDLSNLIISNNAYNLLGEVCWTKNYVQYPNYTTDNKRPILNNSYSDLFDKTTGEYLLNVEGYTNLKFDDELLLRSIFYFLNRDNFTAQTFNNNNNGFQKTFENAINNYDNDINYYTNENLFKIFYFCKLFLNSLRFYYSYITSIRFIPISGISYAYTLPILRCDLGMFQEIISITIVSGKHLYKTALPAGPITNKTSITLELSANVLYKGLSTVQNITFPLVLTFGNIDNWTLSEGDNFLTKYKWVRLIPTHITNIPSITDNTNPALIQYGDNTYFKHLLSDNDSYINTTDASLGIIPWPLNDDSLEIGNLEALYRKNIQFEEDDVADTYDINTFNNDLTIYNDVISQNIMPFGKLRIHNVFADDTEESAMNSSYYIDINLLRVKNYYFITDFVNSLQGVDLNIYYNQEVIYNNNNNYIIPNTNVFVIERSMNNNNTDIDSNPEEYYNTLLNNDKYYVLSNNTFNNPKFILYIKTTTKQFKLYLSGAKEVFNDSNNQGSEIEYTNSVDTDCLQFYSKTSTSTEWTLFNNIRAYNSSDTTLTEPFYQVMNLNGISFLKIVIKNQSNTDEKYYYIKVSNNKGDKQINICPLFTTTSNINNQTLPEQRLVSTTQSQTIMEQEDFKCGYVLYEKSDNYILYSNRVSFNKTSSVNTAALSNLYLKLTSFNVAGSIISLSNYIYDDIPNDIKLYTCVPYKNIGTLIYYKFKDYNNLFEEQQLDTIPENDPNKNIYISLSPITIVLFIQNNLISNLKLIKIYYKENTTESVIENNNTFINSYRNNINTKIYLKTDSFNILNNFINSAIYMFTYKLTYNTYNDLTNELNMYSYTFITNDMTYSINNISNLNILKNNQTIIKLENESLQVKPDNTICIRVYMEHITDNSNGIGEQSNINIEFLNIDSNYIQHVGSCYFVNASSVSFKIKVTMNNNQENYFYGIYDSVSTIFTMQNEKTYNNITSDLTIIGKLKY